MVGKYILDTQMNIIIKKNQKSTRQTRACSTCRI